METSPSSSPPSEFEYETYTEEKIGAGFQFSIALHLLFLSVFFARVFLFPAEPKPYTPVLRVDWVGLPDLLKSQMKNLPPLPTEAELPTPPAGPAANPAEPAEKVPQPVSPPVASPDELVLHPKKLKTKERLPEPEAQKKPRSSTRELKLRSSLARIKALNQMQEEELPTSSSPVLKGNQISRGSQTSGDAKESNETQYYDSIHSKLLENWSLPVWLARKNLSAQVQLYIDSSGRVRDIRWIKPSGNSTFDDAVRSAIQASEPFARPPADWASSLLVYGIKLGFPL